VSGWPSRHANFQSKVSRLCKEKKPHIGFNAALEEPMARMPSLRSVAVFVAAGRALSFAAAADTLGLTPSAVSRRVANLEQELGVALFRRFNRRIELTAPGTRYLEAVGGALDLIERESAALRPPRRQTTLRLSVLQSFATLWLLPRLAAFKRARPDLDVEIETSTELVDLTDGRHDAAIRFGTGRWPGLAADRLFATRVFPVAAPSLLRGSRPVTPAALDRAVLFGIVQTPDLWPQYLQGVGLGDYRPRRRRSFDNVQVMYEAAANGLGIALATDELAGTHLASGRLVKPFSNEPVALRQSYYLVYRKERVQPALRALRAALLGRVR
jgi:LysR family glycine cleavage system transcriptional activator